MQVYEKKLIPYIPLSGLDDNILTSAKEIGLEKYLPKIKKYGKTKFYDLNKSKTEIKKTVDRTVNTKKTISIRVGPNNVHEILDKIVPEH